MSLRLSFFGGGGTVTGSKYLVEDTKHRLLIDCSSLAYANTNPDIIMVQDRVFATQVGHRAADDGKECNFE